MVAEVIDYRVSRIVILCKDCGQDVGMYPARHKCGIDPNVPAVPPIPSGVSTSSSGTSSWAKLKAAKDNGKLSADNHGNVTKTHSRNNSGSGEDSSENHSEGLWNKLRAVRNWKDVSEGATPTTQTSQGSKLWDKLLSATSTLKENISNMGADSENESEKEDWEGETHISRVLREYHEKKSKELPAWLYSNDSRRKKRGDMISASSNGKISSNSNSSQQNSEETYNKISFRDIYESVRSDGNNVNSGGIGNLSNSVNRKPRLWESDVDLPKQSSKDNQLSAHRFAVHEGGNASSLPKNYETRNYIGRSKTNVGNTYKNGSQLESQFGAPNNHRLGVQEEGNASSLPKNYETRNYMGWSNTQKYDHSQPRYSDAPPIPTPSSSARNTLQKDSYLQYRSGQYFENDSINRARTINHNHALPQGRSSNRQGGYF